MAKQMDASKLIDKQIAGLGDWRGKTFTKLRKMIHDANPGVAEEWSGTPPCSLTRDWC